MRQTMLATFLRAGGPFDSAQPDERLLADFFANQDERAFATLVRRHERTVWGVCKRVLSNTADAEDAFQATFLVLVCRGRTLADRGSIGGWLYRVAYRIALKARTMANKRRLREERAAKPDSVPPEPDEPSDLMAVVGEELERLPEHHRLAIIVCDLDGLSRADAANRLGCSEGTLSARLSRGRKQLADRLRKRGIATPAIGLGTLLAVASPAAAGLGSSTAGLAKTVSIMGISNRAVSASVAALVSGTTREMTMRFTTKLLAVLVLTTGMVGGGWFGWSNQQQPTASAAPVPVVKDETKVELPGTAYELLRHRKVLKELKCTAEQRVAIEDAFDDLGEKRPAGGGFAIEINPGNANNPQAIQQQIEAQMQKQRDAAAAEAKGIGAKHLKNDQLVRLGQIELQVRGAKAFTDAKVVDELKLTDEQKKVAKEAIEELEAAPPGFGGGAIPAGPGVARPAIAFAGAFGIDPKKQAAAVEKIVGGLTKDQQATWKKLVGEKIAFELPHAGMTTAFGGGAIRIAPGIQALPALPVKPKDE